MTTTSTTCARRCSPRARPTRRPRRGCPRSATLRGATRRCRRKANAPAGRRSRRTSAARSSTARCWTRCACAARTSFVAALNANLPGIDATLAPDLEGFDISAFLRRLTLPTAIAARHTVGMLDPLGAADATGRPPDELPCTLPEVIARYGHRHFKLKLRGDPDADIARLAAIAGILDALPDYAVTLDGNEQFPDAAAVGEFVAGCAPRRRCTARRRRTLSGAAAARVQRRWRHPR